MITPRQPIQSPGIVQLFPSTSELGRYCCKTLFGSLKTNFAGCGRGDRLIVRGTTATSDEFTGNFGSALEGTSIGDYRFVALLAEKSLKPIFGVLQRNLHRNRLVQRCVASADDQGACGNPSSFLQHGAGDFPYAAKEICAGNGHQTAAPPNNSGPLWLAKRVVT